MEQEAEKMDMVLFWLILLVVILVVAALHWIYGYRLATTIAFRMVVVIVVRLVLIVLVAFCNLIFQDSSIMNKINDMGYGAAIGLLAVSGGALLLLYFYVNFHEASKSVFAAELDMLGLRPSGGYSWENGISEAV